MGAKIVVRGSSEKRVLEPFNSSLSMFNYDFDNAYPQRIKNTGSKSPTTVNCWNTKAVHLNGRSFLREDLRTLIVDSNAGTLTSLQEAINSDFSIFNGAYVHVNINANLDAVEVRHIPFEHVRYFAVDQYAKPSAFLVYDNWEKQKYKRYSQDLIKKVEFYNPDKLVRKQKVLAAGSFEKYNGEIAWMTASGRLEYPVASCDAVFEDVESDHLSKVYSWRQFKRGFKPDGYFFYNGTFENEQEQNDFADSLNENTGAENSNNILLITERGVPSNKDEQSGFVAHESKSTDTMYVSTEDRVKRRIINIYGQPTILHGVDKPGALGLQKEWEEAVKNYDDKTARERKNTMQFLLPVLNELYPSMILTEADLVVIPVTGLEKQKDNRTLAEVIGVGGITSMTEILQSTLTDQQKINYLIVAFGIEKPTATALVMGTELQEAAA